MKKIIYILLLFPLISFSISELKKNKIKDIYVNEINNDNLSYKAMIIIDDKNNEYFSYNKTEVRALASITKLITSKLIIDDIKKNKYSFDSKVHISKKAASVKYGYRIKENQIYTVKDLLNMVLLNSSNSAAYALAEYSSNNNLDFFIKQMNEEVKKMGLKSIRFQSPNGLAPLDSGFSKLDIGNARDLSLLALKLINEKEILNITKNHSYFLENGDKISSTNPLIEKNSEIRGLKTGYHSIAKYNIINYIEINGEKFIQVILGAKNIENRARLSKMFLNILKEEDEK